MIMPTCETCKFWELSGFSIEPTLAERAAIDVGVGVCKHPYTKIWAVKCIFTPPSIFGCNNHEPKEVELDEHEIQSASTFIGPALSPAHIPWGIGNSDE